MALLLTVLTHAHSRDSEKLSIKIDFIVIPYQLGDMHRACAGDVDRLSHRRIAMRLPLLVAQG